MRVPAILAFTLRGRARCPIVFNGPPNMHCTAIFHTSEYAKFAGHVQQKGKSNQMSGEKIENKTISRTLHTSKYCSLIIFIPISVK